MRIFAAVLAITLLLLQGRLWLSDRGLREVSGLQISVDAQKAANHEQAQRNRQLSAEVANLKVAASETFYQVVRTNTPAPAAPASPVTARRE